MSAETHLSRADVAAALRAAGCVYADDETQLLRDAAAGAAEVGDVRVVSDDNLEATVAIGTR